MTKQEIAEVIKTKLEAMIDNRQTGYLQINIGVGGRAVIHTHIIQPPIKIISEVKKVLDKT